MYQWFSQNAARVAAALALGAATIAMPRPATAVIIEGGSITTDGVNSTVDRYYFSVGVSESLSVAALELAAEPPRIARLSLKIYRNDGTLDASDLLYSADASGVGDAAQVPSSTFAVGSYVTILSEYPLAVGEFGPVHAAPVSANYNYELALAGTAEYDLSITGICRGNLNGTFTSGASAPCPVVAPVPEPSSLLILAVGAGLLLGARRARRQNPLASLS